MAFDEIRIGIKYLSDSKDAIADANKLRKSIIDLAASMNAFNGTKLTVSATPVAQLAQATNKLTASRQQLTGATAKHINTENLLYQIYEKQSSGATKKYLSSLTGLSAAYRKLGADAAGTVVRVKGVEVALDSAAGKSAMTAIKVDLLAKTLDNMTTKMIQSGKQMQMIGRQMTTVLTLPLLAAGTAAVKFGMELNQVNVSLQTALLGRGAQFAAIGSSIEVLNKQSRQLSETWGAFSQIDISNVQEQATHIAKTLSDVQGLTKLTVEFGGIAGIKDLSEAGSLVNLLYMNLNHSVADTTKTVHEFNAVSQVTNLNLGDMVKQFPEIIGMSKAYNADLGKTAVLLSAFTVQSGNARSATNSLARVYATIPGIMEAAADGYKAGNKEIKDYIDQYAKLNNMKPTDLFFGPNGKALEGTQAVMNFAKFYGSMTDKAQGQLDTVFFGKFKIQQIKPFLKVINDSLTGAGAGAVEIQKAMKSIQDMQTTDVWTEKVAAILGSDSNKIKADINALINSARQLGITLLPALVNIADKFKELVDRFEAMSPHTKKLIGEFALLAASLGPLNSALGVTKLALGQILQLGITRPLSLFVRQRIEHVTGPDGGAGAMVFNGLRDGGPFGGFGKAMDAATKSTQDLTRQQIASAALLEADKTGKYGALAGPARPFPTLTNNEEIPMANGGRTSLGSLKRKLFVKYREQEAAARGVDLIPANPSEWQTVEDPMNPGSTKLVRVPGRSERMAAAQARLNTSGLTSSYNPSAMGRLIEHADPERLHNMAMARAKPVVAFQESYIEELKRKKADAEEMQKYIDDYYNIFGVRGKVSVNEIKDLITKTEQVMPSLANEPLAVRINTLRKLYEDQKEVIGPEGEGPVQPILSEIFTGKAVSKGRLGRATPITASYKQRLSNDYVENVAGQEEKDRILNEKTYGILNEDGSIKTLGYEQEYKRRAELLYQETQNNTSLLTSRQRQSLGKQIESGFNGKQWIDNNYKLDGLVDTSSGLLPQDRPDAWPTMMDRLIHGTRYADKDSKFAISRGNLAKPNAEMLETLRDRFDATPFKKLALQNLGLTPDVADFEQAVGKEGTSLIKAKGLTKDLPKALATKIQESTQFGDGFWNLVALKVWGGASQGTVEKKLLELVDNDPQLAKQFSTHLAEQSLRVAKNFNASPMSMYALDQDVLKAGGGIYRTQGLFQGGGHGNVSEDITNLRSSLNMGISPARALKLQEFRKQKQEELKATEKMMAGYDENQKNIENYLADLTDQKNKILLKHKAKGRSKEDKQALAEMEAKRLTVLTELDTLKTDRQPLVQKSKQILTQLDDAKAELEGKKAPSKKELQIIEQKIADHNKIVQATSEIIGAQSKQEDSYEQAIKKLLVERNQLSQDPTLFKIRRERGNLKALELEKTVLQEQADKDGGFFTQRRVDLVQEKIDRQKSLLAGLTSTKEPRLAEIEKQLASKQVKLEEVKAKKAVNVSKISKVGAELDKLTKEHESLILQDIKALDFGTTSGKLSQTYMNMLEELLVNQGSLSLGPIKDPTTGKVKVRSRAEQLKAISSATPLKNVEKAIDEHFGESVTPEERTALAKLTQTFMGRINRNLGSIEQELNIDLTQLINDEAANRQARRDLKAAVFGTPDELRRKAAGQVTGTDKAGPIETLASHSYDFNEFDDHPDAVSSVVTDELVREEDIHSHIQATKKGLKDEVHRLHNAIETNKKNVAGVFARVGGNYEKQLTELQLELQRLDYSGDISGLAHTKVKNRIDKLNQMRFRNAVSKYGVISPSSDNGLVDDTSELNNRLAANLTTRRLSKLSNPEYRALASLHAQDILEGNDASVYSVSEIKNMAGTTHLGKLRTKIKAAKTAKNIAHAGPGIFAGPAFETFTKSVASAVPSEIGEATALTTAGSGGAIASVGAMASSFGALAVAAAPFVAIAAAIGGAIFLIFKNWKDVSKGIGNGLKELKNGFSALFGAIVNPFKDVLQSIGLFGNKSTATGKQMSEFWKGVGTILNGAFRTLGDTLKVVAVLIKPVAEVLSGVLAVAIRVVMAAVDLLSGHWKAFFADLARAAGSIVGIVLTPFRTILEALTHIPLLPGKGLIKDAIAAIDSLRSGTIGAGKDADKMTNSYMDAGKGAADSLDGATASAAGLSDQMDQLTQDQNDFVSALKTSVEQMTTQWKNDALKAINASTTAQKAALDQQTKNQKDAIDDQIKDIDRKIAALDEQNRIEDNLAKQTELQQAGASIAAEGAATMDMQIAQGNVGDAKLTGLKMHQDLAKNAIEMTQAQKDADREAAKDSLTAQKQALQDQKDAIDDALSKQKQAIDDYKDNVTQALDDTITEITKHAPRTAAEASKMQDQIIAALKEKGVSSAVIEEATRHYPEAWSKALKDAQAEMNNANYWKDVRNVLNDNAKPIADALGTTLLESLKGLGYDAINQVLNEQDTVLQGAIAAGQQIMQSIGQGSALANQPKPTTNTGSAYAGLYTGSPSFKPPVFPKHHSGGYIKSDEVPAILQQGEFVVQKKAVNAIGLNNLKKINRYHDGGVVDIKDPYLHLFEGQESKMKVASDIEGDLAFYQQIGNHPIKDAKKLVKDNAKTFLSYLKKYPKELQKAIKEVDFVSDSHMDLLNPKYAAFADGDRITIRESLFDKNDAMFNAKMLEHTVLHEIAHSIQNLIESTSGKNFSNLWNYIENKDFVLNSTKPRLDLWSVAADTISKVYGGVLGPESFSVLSRDKAFNEYGKKNEREDFAESLSTYVQLGKKNNLINDYNSNDHKYSYIFKTRAKVLDILLGAKKDKDLQKLFNIPSLDVGGLIESDGIAKVHKNERVMSVQETKNMGAGDFNLALHFDGGFFGSNAEIDKLVDTIERKILPKINRSKGIDNTRVVSSY